jgi:hypothetical protein
LEEDQRGGHEIDGKMPYRGMQQTCYGFGTARLQQEIRRTGGRSLGRPWPENGPKNHRRRIRRYKISWSHVDWRKFSIHLSSLKIPPSPYSKGPLKKTII